MSLTHAPNSIGRNKKGLRQAGPFFMHAVGFGPLAMVTSPLKAC
ncbi:hypothetical protein OFEAOIEE_LOCUS3229 [Methylorubrum extorquens]